jgi:hypothetical protein
MRIDAHARRDHLATLQLGHDLADAIDQDILVIDRRQALDAGGDFQPVIAVAIALDGGFRLLGQRIERMLHMLHHVLQNSVRHIADEQIMLRVTIGQKRRKRVRVFSYHSMHIRVFSYRCQDSCFQLPKSGFQLPRFVFSVTGTCGNTLLSHQKTGLRNGVTQNLTHINTTGLWISLAPRRRRRPAERPDRPVIPTAQSGLEKGRGLRCTS